MAVATTVFLVASGSMPFVGGGGGAAYGVPISWSDAVSAGDPHALDDGFEHFVVTFAGLGEQGAAPVEEPTSGAEAPDASSSATGEKHVRRVPLQTNAAGEISGSDLVELSKQGNLLGIVSDGTTTYAEIEVTGQGVKATEGAAEKVEKKAPKREEPAKGDLLASLLKKVPGTKTVTPVMPGMYAVVTTAKASAFRALAGVADVDEDVVLTVSAKEPTPSTKADEKAKAEAEKAEKATKADAKAKAKDEKAKARAKAKAERAKAKAERGRGASDPGYGAQWALDNKGQAIRGKAGKPGADIGAADAWAVSKGKGQLVAVLDTGIDITHPDLAKSIWRNTDEVCANGKDDDGNGYVDDCRGYDFANNDASVFDAGSDNAHGTHVAGIIAAQSDNGVGVAGIAPEVEIMPIKIGNSGAFRMSDVVRGIEYALANGATIINTAFGTPEGTNIEGVTALDTAIRHAQAAEVLVVVAAGNAGRDIDRSPTYPASFPEDNVIAVGASTNTGDPSEFSNFGAASVDLSAPGTDIVSTLPGGEYGGMSGTSMAAPMVAGSAALILATMPSLAPAEVKALMIANTTEPASSENDPAALDVGHVLNEDETSATEPVRFFFDGFSGASDDVAMAGSVRATVAADQVPSGANVGVRATLVTAVDGVMYGVVGAPVELGSGVAKTDDDASVTLSPAAGFSPEAAGTPMPFGYTLPAGEYALVAEAYATTTDATIGRPWSVFFTVAAEGAVAPDPIVAPSPVGEGSASPDGTISPVPSSGSGTRDVTVPVPGTTSGGSGNGGSSTPTSSPDLSDEASVGDKSETAPTPAQGDSSFDSRTTSGGSTPQPEDVTSPVTAPSAVKGGSQDSPIVPITAPTAFDGGKGSSTGSSEAVAVDLPPLPSPVSSGALGVVGLSPRYGSVEGGEVVLIDGSGFRPTMYVRFGTRAARVLAISPTQVAVVTPSHIAGTSDLTVALSGGDTVTMADAYSFVEPTPAAAPSSGVGSSGPSSSVGAGSDEGTASAGSDDSSSGAAGPSSDTGDVPTSGEVEGSSSAAPDSPVVT
ncbi:MAG: S8 family serine peptidase, partial [Acidimicrobiales bacterium]